MSLGGFMVAGADVRRGFVYGRSDRTASGPLDNPMHPTDLLATVYHSLGIDPGTIRYNHRNQPRELVQGDVVRGQPACFRWGGERGARSCQAAGAGTPPRRGH